MNRLYYIFLGSLIFILFVVIPQNTLAADLEIAGRVMTIDRPLKTFTVQPYQNQPIQTLVVITVTNKTLYEYHPALTDLPTASIDKVKRGTWVRVTYQGAVASRVVIHMEQLPNVPSKSPQSY